MPTAATRAAIPVLALLLVLGAVGRASGFEFFDGRLQVHGFYEAQLRGIARDFDSADDVDITQWWNILNLEIEGDLAPNGLGPFEVLQSYLRLEVRYDCVWKRSCGIFSSADVFGDRANRVPKRLGDGRRAGYRSSGQVNNGDIRPYADIARRFLGSEYSRVGPEGPEVAVNSVFLPGAPGGFRRPSEFFAIEGLDTLFDTRGQDEIFGVDSGSGRNDDGAPFYFSDPLRDCVFNFRKTNGSQVGIGTQIMGPWNPSCPIRPLAVMAGKPNPQRGPDDFYGVDRPDPGDVSPILLNQTETDNRAGFGDNPLRPAPVRAATQDSGVFQVESLPLTDPTQAQGVYFPNKSLADLIGEDAFDSFDQNFREAELAWNRGASQQDEKELKEAYLDVEMFDNRLWLRLGKQQIVWGKTELFRNQDQWNPQDLALASLPSLEESRIALWAARGVWSFYGVGPFEDVRLELAMLYDQFEPADLGRCGEPYAPNPVCAKTFGLFIHGFTGFGVAGETRPPNPWDDASGTEIGGRLEWRWSRFSFALTEYYGYTDFAFPETIFSYSRNIDPGTGIPRHTTTSERCRTAAFEPDPTFVDDPGDPNFATPGEVRPDGLRNRFFRPKTAGVDEGCLTFETALAEHSVNQQLYHMICATSIGLLASIDPTACGQTLFSSPTQIFTGVRVATLFANLLAGNAFAGQIVDTAIGEPFKGLVAPGFMNTVLVALNEDPCDGDGITSFLFVSESADCETLGPGGASAGPPPNATFRFAGIFDLPTANTTLTVQQHALLGCGEFYGTDCETDGIDLLNAEASVLMQAFPGIEGSFGQFAVGWNTLDPTAQPGTLLFVGGGVATREGGILPGGHGPGDPGWNALVDGCVRPDDFGCDAGDPFPGGLRVDPARTLYHPLAGIVDPTAILDGIDGDEEYDCGAGVDGAGVAGGATPCAVFSRETGALSWNLLMGLVAASTPQDQDGDPAGDTRTPDAGEPTVDIGAGALDVTILDFDVNNPFRQDGCSYAQPALCANVQSFFQISGVQRNTVLAGGRNGLGRRDFVWHGGKDIALDYEKRNILGFSTDFAEDVTKSNWSVELTWQDDLSFADNDQLSGITSGVDTYNMTVSVDRPTFINFLNAGRTFFINTQWFIQYVDGYKSGFTSNGPWNVLGVLAAQTGYFDDRLLPQLTMVYDVRSNSGGFIPQVTYRFTANFNATFGLALFAGREEPRNMAISPVALGNRVGDHAYDDFVENGLSAIRDRDEAFMRIRYSF